MKIKIEVILFVIDCEVVKKSKKKGLWFDASYEAFWCKWLCFSLPVAFIVIHKAHKHTVDPDFEYSTESPRDKEGNDPNNENWENEER